MSDRSWQSEPKVYPSPQYRTQSPTRSWATTSTPRQIPGGWQGQPYPAQQPPASPEPQFWQGQPENTNVYPHGTPMYTSGQYSDYPSHSYPSHNPEDAERETVSDSTLLEQSEDGYPSKSPARSKGSKFYTESDDSRNTLVQQQLPSPAVGMTSFLPVYAHPLRADDYLAQQVNPSTSNPSLTTYIRKVKRFVNKVKSFPWAPEERITVDYYPGMSKRSERDNHRRPMVLWRNPEAYPTGYQSDDMTSATDDSSPRPPGPVHGETSLDLEAQFTSAPATPNQQPPPSIPRQAFENPVPPGYPMQPPKSTAWYSATTQPTPMTTTSAMPPPTFIIPVSAPYYQFAPQVVPSQASSQAYAAGQPAIPMYPGGYVPADQQHLGYLYGPPVHQ